MSNGNNSQGGNKALTNWQIIKLAWNISGGWSYALRALDFKICVVLSLLCFPFWTTPGWWDTSISIIPSLLGFTLSGFAIFLGFGSDSFKSMITSENEAKSEYLSVSSAFLIFVLFQIVGLIYAVVSKALWFPAPSFLKFISLISPYINPIVGFIGYFLLIYSISLGLRAAIRIFRVSRWYNDFLASEFND